MAPPTTDKDRCGKVRASLFYGAPILSEVGACVLPHGHDENHRDPKGGTWNVIPLYPMTNISKGTDE